MSDAAPTLEDLAAEVAKLNRKLRKLRRRCEKRHGERNPVGFRSFCGDEEARAQDEDDPEVPEEV